MIVYFSLLAGAVALGIPLCRNKTGKIIYCCIMGFAVFIIAALRRSTGFDYNDYGWLFIDYSRYSIEEIGLDRYEKGYAIITKLLADYVDEYQIIFVLIAAFFAICTAFIVYKYCNRPWVGFTCFLTVGVYFVTFDFMRQMVAAYIVFYALRYIEKNQFFRYLLIVLFATCFHLSALVMIPFYFILKIKMTPVSLGVYSGLTLFGMIFSWNILEFVTKYYYTGYKLDMPDVIYGCDPSTMIFYGILFIAAFIFRKQLVGEDPMNSVYLNCMCFAFIFEIFGVKHSMISRFSGLFIIPATLILVPRVFEVIVDKCRSLGKKNEKKRSAFTVAAVSGIAVLNIAMYGVWMLTNYNGVMPYRTMFDDFGTEASEQQ